MRWNGRGWAQPDLVIVVAVGRRWVACLCEGVPIGICCRGLGTASGAGGSGGCGAFGSGGGPGHLSGDVGGGGRRTRRCGRRAVAPPVERGLRVDSIRPGYGQGWDVSGRHGRMAGWQAGRRAGGQAAAQRARRAEQEGGRAESGEPLGPRRPWARRTAAAGSRRALAWTAASGLLAGAAWACRRDPH